jgi:predicted transcriptional regulator
MNLQELVQTLIDGGLSETEIAKRIGVSQPTINRIKSGTDPAYTTGKRLEELCHRMNSRKVVITAEHVTEN